MNSHILSGKKAICNFLGRGWSIVEKWIIYEGFPATKIDGIWESDSDLITKWRQKRVANGNNRQKKLMKSRGNPNLQ